MPEPRQDRRLCALTFLAAFMALGHHVDHVIRGNNVGWPITDEVNAFTYSLVIYPLILVGLLLFRFHLVGPGFWDALAFGWLLALIGVLAGTCLYEARLWKLSRRRSPP